MLRRGRSNAVAPGGASSQNLFNPLPLVCFHGLGAQVWEEVAEAFAEGAEGGRHFC